MIFHCTASVAKNVLVLVPSCSIVLLLLPEMCLFWYHDVPLHWFLLPQLFYWYHDVILHLFCCHQLHVLWCSIALILLPHLPGTCESTGSVAWSQVDCQYDLAPRQTRLAGSRAALTALAEWGTQLKQLPSCYAYGHHDTASFTTVHGVVWHWHGMSSGSHFLTSLQGSETVSIKAMLITYYNSGVCHIAAVCIYVWRMTLLFERNTILLKPHLVFTSCFEWLSDFWRGTGGFTSGAAFSAILPPSKYELYGYFIRHILDLYHLALFKEASNSKVQCQTKSLLPT